MANVSSLPPALQNKVMTPCRHLVPLVSRAVPSLILFLEHQIIKTGSERPKKTLRFGPVLTWNNWGRGRPPGGDPHITPQSWFCPLVRSPVQSWPVRNQFTAGAFLVAPSCDGVCFSVVTLLICIYGFYARFFLSLLLFILFCLHLLSITLLFYLFLSAFIQSCLFMSFIYFWWHFSGFVLCVFTRSDLSYLSLSVLLCSVC